MKFLVGLCVILFLAVAFVKSQSDELTPENCKEIPKSFRGQCVIVRCNKDNSQIAAVGCPELRCPGKTLRIEEDRSKPYPDCCPRPICE